MKLEKYDRGGKTRWQNAYGSSALSILVVIFWACSLREFCVGNNAF